MTSSKYGFFGLPRPFLPSIWYYVWINYQWASLFRALTKFLLSLTSSKNLNFDFHWIQLVCITLLQIHISTASRWSLSFFFCCIHITPLGNLVKYFIQKHWTIWPLLVVQKEGPGRDILSESAMSTVLSGESATIESCYSSNLRSVPLFTVSAGDHIWIFHQESSLVQHLCIIPKYRLILY